MRQTLFPLLLVGLAAALPTPTRAETVPPAQPKTCESIQQPIDCTAREAAVSDARRDRAYAAISKGWDGERRAAFVRLRAAADGFAHAAARASPSVSWDASISFVATEQAEKDAFLHTLRHLGTGKAKRPSLIAFDDADSALNAAYTQVMAMSETADAAWGSVDKDGIRRTERAWLVYRNAFVAFARQVDGDGAAERIKTELTARRTASLEAFLAD